MSYDVYITGTSAYMPFEPVTNDEMEAVLGQVGGEPSRARRVVLRSNGIESRHYAIDRSTGKQAMTNAQLTARAVQALGDVGPVDVLACGTTSPDQIAPGHAVMVHGELGWPSLEAVSMAGICASGAAALKHAWLNLRAGDAERAVATGSEMSSAHMRAWQFEAEAQHKVQQLEERPEIAFEKDFLRWMLSDGAGAALLERKQRCSANEDPTNVSLRIEWIDMGSAAHELPVCMYAGADKDEDGTLRGWTRFSADTWTKQSIFSFKQDVRLLNENIVRATFIEPMKRIMARRGLGPDSVDWFLPHLSSHYFVREMVTALPAVGLDVPVERRFTNLKTKGNTGSASPYIMLDELRRSGRIRAGERLLMFVPESGRFSCAFIYMTAM